MSCRLLRNTLAGLQQHGVLIRYELSARWGQNVRVWDERGLPVRMGLGAARMYLRRLDEAAWWA